MRKWSKLLAAMRFIFPALRKKGGRVSGLGDVPPPARSASLPLSPHFCSSCKLLVAVTLLSGPETSSGLHLFIWAAQILGFYCPACSSHTVEAGRHTQCQAQQGTELPRTTGRFLTHSVELQCPQGHEDCSLVLGVKCMKCIQGSPAAGWKAGARAPVTVMLGGGCSLPEEQGQGSAVMSWPMSPTQVGGWHPSLPPREQRAAAFSWQCYLRGVSCKVTWERGVCLSALKSWGPWVDPCKPRVTSAELFRCIGLLCPEFPLK